ncbi:MULTISPECIES: carboxymuconolactone decarboxylase family protein [Novosphingobium]|uniref:Carboxymuconolactone decarboxylase family protein n=1 Tax=Novosphingobium mangrovi (ex Hu et al. 2023) TaxID=2930094 RepID=A0ABT0A7I3_9SPHN|nr:MULTISPECIES: carboxymuconolactone decarboxylase family protein [Novosphingobium]MCJ1959141.1 carboxymuconolactone decarboxylase family protein [Novosphingobium mangrovi (ex Hu et al. 2023)]
MSKSNFHDWPQMAKDLNPAIGELKKSSPGPMQAFSEMGKAALAPGALDTKTKELIALAIGVAVRCGPCITYHSSGAQRAGATREEIAEAMGLAVYMGAGPSAMYAAQALEAFDQWDEKASG